MRQAEDQVWAAITESAKQRFDYAGFKNRLSKTGDDRIADFILYLIIEGYAEKLSLTELMSVIRRDLELFGYPVSEDELSAVLADKEEILTAEIHAAREALVGFAQGISAPELLPVIQEILL